MKLNTVFPIIFFFISFVFAESTLLTSAKDVTAALQKLAQINNACSDDGANCDVTKLGPEFAQISATTTKLIHTLEGAGGDSHAAKSVHEEGEKLQKLREAVAQQAQTRELRVKEEGLGDLDQAIKKLLFG